MTQGHQHWLLVVDSRRKAVLARALRKRVFRTWDEEGVDQSPYPYGYDETDGSYYLSLLSILHRWTGLTLYWPDGIEGMDEYREG